MTIRSQHFRFACQRYLPVLLVAISAGAMAEDSAPSVEDNIRAMDTNRDGMVTVHEMREFLELKNGKGYRQELLDELEGKTGRSCASPFSKSAF